VLQFHRNYFLALVSCVLSLVAVPSTSAQSLPSGWATTDVGAVGAMGTASGSGSAFTVTGAGADIWGTADAFRYVYLPLTGDGSIVAKVASIQYVNDWTKAGVMMRASLTAGSQQATMLVAASSTKGLAFQRRTTAGGGSTHTSGGTGTAPAFVKLVRSGNVFTAYKSPDGAVWTTVGSDTISMPSTIYVGLAVSSHVAGSVATAAFGLVAVSGNTAPPAPSTAASVETIVFLRHGEKPSGGYGQITCQGLQRALSLPAVLASRFGAPHYIFAPNPVPKVSDNAGQFYYVRPLATIEPTAIKFGLPVNAQYGYTDIAGLQAELTVSRYASSTIFVAWEHLKLVEIVQNIMNAYNSGVTVPAWTSGDYDSLYVVQLATATNGTVTAQFARDYEGLNNLPTTCP
jgi:hypothetical protein